MLSLICMCGVWSLLSPHGLSYPSLKPRCPPQHLSLICHVCYVASIVHVTFDKQTISPIVSSLRAVFFPPGLFSTFCPFSCYICHICVSNPVSPLGATSCPAPVMSVTPNNSPLRVHHLPLNCHTCCLFPPLPSASLCCVVLSLSDGYAIVSHSGRCAEY